MEIFTPAAWEGVGAPALLVLLVVVLLVGVAREWIIPGKYDQRMVDSKDATIAILEARLDKRDEQIDVLADSVAKNTIANELTAHVLDALRKAAEANKEVT